MNTTMRITLLAPLMIVLGACSNLTERQMETCVVGLTTAGGLIGAASSGGTGVLPGAVIGTGISLISCEQGEEAAAPRQAPPADSDTDGVPDNRDRCPRTPAGVNVDEIGCPIKDEVVLTINRLGFDFDSAELDRSSKAALDRAVAVIKSHSEAVNLNVVGHTDSRGDEAYNQKLSERRADAVVDYLVSKGVSRSSLSSSGKGESEPMASNDTEDGRAQNRRVELVVE